MEELRKQYYQEFEELGITLPYNYEMKAITKLMKILLDNDVLLQVDTF